MSEALVWELLRKNNCFVRKQGGVQFSTEKGNVLGVNSFKASGLANRKTADVCVNKNGAVVLSVKSKKEGAERKPAAMYRAVPMKKGSRKAVKVTEKMLSSYRPDLKSAAMVRVSKLIRAQNKQRKAVKAE
eukprot:CAMPEP_0185833254 /NCGR_PEP_ID=MMETSP1353-20130828/2564_1 /TAXON_ID=1077150 /ORGANISM="Erythrolobus australicus, Strain CCMP3124" /LENGTH=130 /DNA_ID=CAMNT_0028531513 /DNA_START=60 /DNA_END=452 /DNA_ORIENTATION=-